MEIVTGSTGQVHVTSIDDAVRNGNPGYLNGKVVFTFLQNFAATIVTNNQVKIGSGYGMNQGRIFKIDEGEFDLVTIENGSQGYKRTDIIVARYTMNTQSGFEDIHLEAIRGTSGNSYVDPAYSTGNINQGATQDDMPLYRVKINGLVIEAVERMFTLVPDGGRLGELEAKYENHMKYFNKVNIRTNLSTENVPLLKDGGETGNIRPGVEGTLPASHGGTGQTTLKAAGDSIIGSLGDNNTAPTDTTVFVGSTPNTAGFQKKTMASLWMYLTGKIRTLLGMGTNDVVPISHGGTGKNSISNSTILVGSNGAFVEKTLTTTLVDPSNDKIPTTKAVSDSLQQKGYGDMLQKTFCTTETSTIISPTHGGTGQNTLNATRNVLGLGNDTTKPLPVANGGSGLTTSPSMLTNLGSTTAAAIMQAAPRPGVTGTLSVGNGGTGQTTTKGIRNAIGIGGEVSDAVPIGNGGTGLKASPSMLTNLGTTAAANVLQASPRPGVTGTLPVGNGGTGITSNPSMITNLGTTAAASVFQAAPRPGVTGTLPVGNGGTGQTSLQATRNAMGLGNTTGALPVANGGTGSTSASGARSNLGAASASDLSAAMSIIAAHDSSIAALSAEVGKKMPKAGGTFGGNVTINHLGETSMLQLGNSTQGSSTAAATSGGVLRLYNRGTGYYNQMRFENSLTASRGMYIPNSTGTIQVSSSSSRRVKENIRNMTEERAKKLLDLDIVNFDYIGEFAGGLKDQSGVIAEDAIKVIPEAVLISENYDESKPVDEISNPAPSVDYRQYIPYLIKMVQIQQKEIEELKKR
jgi:hypothetical protein